VAVGKQIVNAFIVNLVETDSDATVATSLLLVKDKLQGTWQNASLATRQSRLVVIEVRVVLRTVPNYSVSLACASLPTESRVKY